MDAAATEAQEMLLQQMAEADPRVRLIAQAIAGGSSQETLRRQARERRLQRLLEDNERLSERNDLLADALGACPACWGDDPACRLCRGRGRPGFSIPAEDAFRDVVGPVLERLGWSRTYHLTEERKRVTP